MQGFQVLGARFEDSQRKLAIAEAQVRSNEERVRSAKEQIHDGEEQATGLKEQVQELKERIRQLEEQTYSAEVRGDMLAAEEDGAQTELATCKSVWSPLPPPPGEFPHTNNLVGAPRFACVRRRVCHVRSMPEYLYRTLQVCFYSHKGGRGS